MVPRLHACFVGSVAFALVHLMLLLLLCICCCSCGQGYASISTALFDMIVLGDEFSKSHEFI